jgi:hypothetical protein
MDAEKLPPLLPVSGAAHPTRTLLLRRWGKSGLGLILFFVVLALSGLLIGLVPYGTLWLSAKAYPVVEHISFVTLLAAIVIFLPMLIVKRSRPWGGVAL